MIITTIPRELQAHFIGKNGNHIKQIAKLCKCKLRVLDNGYIIALNIDIKNTKDIDRIKLLVQQDIYNIEQRNTVRNVTATSHQLSNTLICMDALNFSGQFNPKNISESQLSIKRFVDICKKQNNTLKVFIDAKRSSDETNAKWIKRREDECRDGTKKGVSHCWSILLGDIFRECGIEVLYSLYDCDDTIATYANVHNGVVLSSDKDYYRYTKHSYTIYSSFEIDDNCIRFILQNPPALPREPLPLFNSCYPTVPLHPTADEVWETHHYLRGVPSPYTREYGNPHGYFENVRKHLYYINGLRSAVTEEYPEYDENQNIVVWKKKMVMPQITDIDFSKPSDIVRRFGQLNAVHPIDHKRSVWLVVLELVSIVTKQSLLTLFNQYQNCIV